MLVGFGCSLSLISKDELENLTSEQEKMLKRAIEAELKVRGTL